MIDGRLTGICLSPSTNNYPPTLLLPQLIHGVLQADSSEILYGFTGFFQNFG